MKISHKRRIQKISGGLFNNVLDLAIFSIAFVGHGQRGKLPWEAAALAFRSVSETRPRTYRRAIYNARHKGYLARKKDYYEITELGRQRLKKVLPSFEAKRPWDGKLYLVTYDIPESKKQERNYLRDLLLKKLGCGMLQKSVWMTPFNPTGVLVDFIKEKRLVGLVLVSELREGSFIGGKHPLEVVARVFQLERLNEKYRRFCLKVEEDKLKEKEVVIEFLSILKIDPQLPFELLPPNWWGGDAYRIYQKALKKSGLPDELLKIL
jgi:phenylacetic acid degradation operon negative regulatory protein